MGFRNPVSSNLYELNLDWILFQVKKFAKLIPQMQSAEDDIQTAMNTANEVRGIADNALASANQAQSTANVALSTATNAQTTADGISNTATQALNTANTAQSTATQAQATAEGISDTASQALSTANSALTTAQGISDTASQALSTANTASSNASTALSTANTAQTTADSALSSANTASSNASTALSTANTAQSTADSALSTANTASSNASTALSTANTANSNASTALSTANTAQSTAEDAKQIAEQAVSVSPSDANPSMNGTASAGDSALYSRGNHVHPSDTSKANTDASNITANTWLTALGFTVGSPETTVGNVASAGSGFTISSVNCIKYGKIAQINLAIKRTGATINSEGSYTVANMKSAWMPAVGCAFFCSVGGFLRGSLTSSGEMSARVDSWANDANKTFRAMYILE